MLFDKSSQTYGINYRIPLIMTQTTVYGAHRNKNSDFVSESVSGSGRGQERKPLDRSNFLSVYVCVCLLSNTHLKYVLCVSYCINGIFQKVQTLCKALRRALDRNTRGIASQSRAGCLCTGSQPSNSLRNLYLDLAYQDKWLETARQAVPYSNWEATWL